MDGTHESYILFQFSKVLQKFKIKTIKRYTESSPKFQWCYRSWTDAGAGGRGGGSGNGDEQ